MQPLNPTIAVCSKSATAIEYIGSAAVIRTASPRFICTEGQGQAARQAPDGFSIRMPIESFYLISGDAVAARRWLTNPTPICAPTRPRISSVISSSYGNHLVSRAGLCSASHGARPLALAYAQSHPLRVNALVLALVTTTSRREVQWLTEGVRRIFPQQWERFSNAVSSHLKDRPLVDAYATMLFDSDASVRDRAAYEWCSWEDAHVSLSPNHTPNPRFEDPKFRLRFARLVTHYWKNAAFLEDEQLIRNVSVLNGIPAEMIHGRYDFSSPLDTAWQLSKNWPTSSLHVLNDSGHGGGESFVSSIVGALIRFASREPGVSGGARL